MAEGDSTILGYTCHKATTRFRGRDYVAWYTEEIPLSYGPYKFRGLPGLITCIYDKDRDHVFTLQGFERAPRGGGHLPQEEVLLQRRRESASSRPSATTW